MGKFRYALTGKRPERQSDRANKDKKKVGPALTYPRIAAMYGIPIDEIADRVSEPRLLAMVRAIPFIEKQSAIVQAEATAKAIMGELSKVFGTNTTSKPPSGNRRR